MPERARLAEVAVDAVDVRVPLAGLAEDERALEVLVDRRREPRRSPRRERSVESLNGESFASQRISFACARPMPASARWSRSSGWSWRRSRREDLAEPLGAEAERLRAEVRELGLEPLPGVNSHTPARFFLPASVRTSSPPSAKARRNIGVFGVFAPGAW